MEEGMATHSSILAWRIPWTDGTWWATVHRVAESDMTEVTLHVCMHKYVINHRMNHKVLLNIYTHFFFNAIFCFI